MTVLYLVVFIGGLLVAVRIMTHGVERAPERSPTGDRSFRLSPPIVVGFAVLFGASGYLLERNGVARPISAAVAAGVGIAGAIIAAVSVRKWWQVVPEHDVDDERYILQGQLARVTKTIGPDVDGEVAFDFGGDRRVLRARNAVSGPIAADTDVVIERVEADVAYVESWDEVEKRL